MEKIARWGAAAGVAHFVVIALLYGNPIVDAYSREANLHVAVKHHVPQPAAARRGHQRHSRLSVHRLLPASDGRIAVPIGVTD
jgi:hypothetical protein